MRRIILFALLSLTACSKAPSGNAPHQIHIAGSSAGYILSTQVAERLMREDPDVLAPLVRAGGTGEGIARFCDTDNPTRPDILITTRPMTPHEQARCADNGSADVEQKPIGTTAIALVEAKGAPSIIGLSRVDVANALTSNAKTWADVRPGLPAIPIAIHGPTPTPGIADTLYGPILQESQKVRTDGAYTGHGADAGRVAQLIAAQPGTVGIVPLAALALRNDLEIIHVSGSPHASERPGVDATSDGTLALPLLMIHRPADVARVPGLKRLLGYYDDALHQPREDISRAHPIP